ncbi:MAG: ribonuclease HIII [Firmicutes bacterium]|nr:ribonuclease HIII [Bacillota bacterium]
MNVVLNLDKDQIKRVIQFYRDYQAVSNNETVLFFAKTEFVSVSVYKSNKVMFQGTDAVLESNMWTTMLHLPEVNVPKKQTSKKSPTKDYYVQAIGSDEVGTGDFFGPITVCAAYFETRHLDFIKSLGIDDSKKLTDEKILVIGEQLKDKVLFSLLTLPNNKFNDLTKQGYNMNKIKAYLHNQAILHLIEKCQHTPLVIMDQFAEKDLYFSYLKTEKNVFKDITFQTKAESSFACVAIASIIARYAFLKHFDQMVIDSGYSLLKGASNKVDALTALIIKEKGEAFLYQYAKLNFKTLDKAKELLS